MFPERARFKTFKNIKILLEEVISTLRHSWINAIKTFELTGTLESNYLSICHFNIIEDIQQTSHTKFLVILAKVLRPCKSAH